MFKNILVAATLAITAFSPAFAGSVAPSLIGFGDAGAKAIAVSGPAVYNYNTGSLTLVRFDGAPIAITGATTGVVGKLYSVTSGSFVFTLPSGALAGQEITVLNPGAGTVTMGGGNINGAAASSTTIATTTRKSFVSNGDGSWLAF